MSKLQETISVIESINDNVVKNYDTSALPQEAITNINLAAINGLLGDIALSLAIIADHLREEG